MSRQHVLAIKCPQTGDARWLLQVRDGDELIFPDKVFELPTEKDKDRFGGACYLQLAEGATPQPPVPTAPDRIPGVAQTLKWVAKCSNKGDSLSYEPKNVSMLNFSLRSMPDKYFRINIKELMALDPDHEGTATVLPTMLPKDEIYGIDASPPNIFDSDKAASKITCVQGAKGWLDVEGFTCTDPAFGKDDSESEDDVKPEEPNPSEPDPESDDDGPSPGGYNFIPPTIVKPPANPKDIDNDGKLNWLDDDIDGDDAGNEIDVDRDGDGWLNEYDPRPDQWDPLPEGVDFPGVVGEDKPKKGLSTGGKAGIAIGVIFLVVLLFVAFIFIRRRKRRAITSPRDAEKATGLIGSGRGGRSGSSSGSPHGSGLLGTSTIIAGGAKNSRLPPAPKDDKEILRQFKGLDAKITDFVLNFCMGGGKETYAAQIAGAQVSREVSEVCRGRFEKLVVEENSRVLVLKAVLAGKAFEQMGPSFWSRGFGGNLEPDSSEYDNKRSRAILSLARLLHERLRPFISTLHSDDKVLRSLETVVKALADFATTLEEQTTEFEIRDEIPTPASLEDADFVRFYDVGLEVPRGSGRETKIRCLAFPAFVKKEDGREMVLSKGVVVVA